MDFSKIEIRQSSLSLLMREYYLFRLKLKFKPHIALCFVYDKYINKGCLTAVSTVWDFTPGLRDRLFQLGC